MLQWLKWLVAGKELAELERWRVECMAAEQWLAEFDDARHALQYVSGAAQGSNVESLQWLRDGMRKRRDHVRKFDAAHAEVTRDLPPPDLRGKFHVYRDGRLVDVLPACEPHVPLIDGNALLPRTMSPAELDALAKDWRRTWDSPMQMRDPAARAVADLDAAIDHVLSLPADRLPPLYDGLVTRPEPEPDRVAYRFLSAECGDQS